jgi:hypothetical protein
MRVGVVGAGPIGLLAAAAAVPVGADVAAEARYESQRAAAERLGAATSPRGATTWWLRPRDLKALRPERLDCAIDNPARCGAAGRQVGTTVRSVTRSWREATYSWARFSNSRGCAAGRSTKAHFINSDRVQPIGSLAFLPCMAGEGVRSR